MDFFKRLQKLDVFWKKVIIVIVIVGLGIPLVFFVGKSFQKRVKGFDKEEFLEDVNLPEIKKEMEGVPFEELEKTKRKFEEEIRKLEEMAEQAATSTTSTNNTQ